MDLFSKYINYKCKIKKIILKLIIKDIKFEKDLMFRNNFFIKINGGSIKIGKGCFFNNNCSINSLGSVEIGDDCIFGENVKIYDHNHNYGIGKITSKSGYSIGKVKIKDNVWIGSNVTILKDVVIGKNVVIGANCLIYKSIPDNSVVKCKSHIEIEKMYSEEK